MPKSVGRFVIFFVPLEKYNYFCGYYQNQQLLSEVKRTEVIRYILSGDPANKAMIEKIDTLLKQKGVGKVYKSIISK